MIYRIKVKIKMIDKNRVAICKNCNNTLEWDNLENEWTHIGGKNIFS